MDKSSVNAGAIHFNNWETSHIPEILEEIYLQKIYFDLLVHKKDLILFDVGFNLGLWSFYASKYAKQIYAFEPNKENYDMGVKNMKNNGITNVKAYQKAIAATDGKMSLSKCINTTMHSLNPTMDDKVRAGKEDVETIRFDTFVKENKIEHIDGIKLDIEGFESHVLNSESFINIIPITDWIVYEWHTWDASNPTIINSCLKDNGFKVFKKLASKATVYSCTK
jgi:FkbM family methyltransferase